MKYRIKTITRILPADLQTPVGIYLKVRDLFPQSALLESSDYHTTQNSFSFIGVEPMADFSVTKEQIVRRFPDGRQLTDALTEGVDVIEILKDYFNGQYSDGWGEGFAQTGIETKHGVVYLDF